MDGDGNGRSGKRRIALTALSSVPNGLTASSYRPEKNYSAILKASRPRLMRFSETCGKDCLKHIPIGD